MEKKICPKYSHIPSSQRLRARTLRQTVSEALRESKVQTPASGQPPGPGAPTDRHCSTQHPQAHRHRTQTGAFKPRYRLTKAILTQHGGVSPRRVVLLSSRSARPRQRYGREAPHRQLTGAGGGAPHGPGTGDMGPPGGG